MQLANEQMICVFNVQIAVIAQRTRTPYGRETPPGVLKNLVVIGETSLSRPKVIKLPFYQYYSGHFHPVLGHMRHYDI